MRNYSCVNFKETRSKMAKLKSIIIECIICFRYGVDPRFFIPAIYKKFPKYKFAFPFKTFLEGNSLKHLPVSLKKIVPLLSETCNLKTYYDIFTSFFFFQDYVPKKGWSIIDAGAHKGIYTELCAHLVGQGGRVIAIAYSDVNRPPIPIQSGRAFRHKPATL